MKAARQFGVVRSRIRAWEGTYLEEGAAGFQEERRGGGSKAKTFPGYSPYQRSTAPCDLLINREDKYEAAKAEITAIYHENKGRYGYRCITVSIP